MTTHPWDETLIETTVTYMLDLDGTMILIEGVPARVNRETGEQYFAPETVEHLHAIITSKQPPQRMIETPVFRFAA